MTLHEKAVAYAMKEYRNKVHEVPMGSNKGPRVEHYQTFDFLAGGGYPWCVCFFQASWAEGAGHALPYKTAGAFDLDNWAHKNGWGASLNHLEPGDGICLGKPVTPAGHYCMYLEHSGTQVRTLNGNVGDKVDIREWSIGSIRGCMHVPEVHNLPVQKPPLYVVTTSINGHKKVIVTQRTWKKIAPLMPRIIKNRGWNGFEIKRVR